MIGRFREVSVLPIADGGLTSAEPSLVDTPGVPFENYYEKNSRPEPGLQRSPLFDAALESGAGRVLAGGGRVWVWVKEYFQDLFQEFAIDENVGTLSKAYEESSRKPSPAQPPPSQWTGSPDVVGDQRREAADFRAGENEGFKGEGGYYL